MTEIVIRTEDLCRHFDGVHAVDHLSFEVPAGMVFGFLGPNGAGKTTTIRLLLGLLEPTSGRAEVLGLDTRSQAHAIRARVGALLEHIGLYDRLSARDNLELFGRIWHMPSPQRRDRIEQLLRSVELWDRRDDMVGAFSTGMRKKLAVARALMHRPSVVMLDEPTAGLDPPSATAMRDDLARLVDREGVTVLLTTHNLTEAERLCRRVAVIRKGGLVATGAPDELRDGVTSNSVVVRGSGLDNDVVATLHGQPWITNTKVEHGSLVVTLADGSEVPELVRLLVGAGVAIEEVRRSKPTLEETFLALLDGAGGGGER